MIHEKSHIQLGEMERNVQAQRGKSWVIITDFYLTFYIKKLLLAQSLLCLELVLFPPDLLPAWKLSVEPTSSSGRDVELDSGFRCSDFKPQWMLRSQSSDSEQSGQTQLWGRRALHWTTAAKTKAALLHQFRAGFGCCRIVWLWLMLPPVPQGLWWGTKCFGERERKREKAGAAASAPSFQKKINPGLIQPIHQVCPLSGWCGKLPSFPLWNSLVRQKEVGMQFNWDGSSPSLLRDSAGAKFLFSSFVSSFRGCVHVVC